jgi:hypothetical protein
MTTSTVTYYRETLSVSRTAGTANPTVNSGNQVKITSDIPTATASMIRQSTSIESRVGYTVTMRQRTVTALIYTPPLPSVIVVDFYYLRPDGVSFYRRPDGTSRYVRV